MSHSRRHFPYHIEPMRFVKGENQRTVSVKRCPSLVAIIGITLRHGSCSSQVDLTLDLLASPASSVNCTRAILPAGSCLSDQGGDPVVAEVSSKLAVGEGIGQITGRRQLQANKQERTYATYPSTPIDALIRPSLLLGS